jgi:hypothetical protein
MDWLWQGAEGGFDPRHTCGTVILEEMEVHAHGTARPADLLELAGVGGAVVGALPGWQAEGVLAKIWNGQLPSEIRRARTRAWVEEQGRLACVDLDTTARFQQDVWSAVGIGRWKTTGQR